MDNKNAPPITLGPLDSSKLAKGPVKDMLAQTEVFSEVTKAGLRSSSGLDDALALAGQHPQFSSAIMEKYKTVAALGALKIPLNMIGLPMSPLTEVEMGLLAEQRASLNDYVEKTMSNRLILAQIRDPANQSK